MFARDTEARPARLSAYANDELGSWLSSLWNKITGGAKPQINVNVPIRPPTQPGTVGPITIIPTPSTPVPAPAAGSQVMDFLKTPLGLASLGTAAYLAFGRRRNPRGRRSRRARRR